MPVQKILGNANEERLKIVKTIIDYEESCNEKDRILLAKEIYTLRNVFRLLENEWICYAKALEDEDKANDRYLSLFKTAQMYISHFIQVLNLSVIRGEIKIECKGYYGLDKEAAVPDLYTEEAILKWGDKIIQGEAKRLSFGGLAIYNPAISKVKVFCELFKDSCQNLKIYRQNVVRFQKTLERFESEIDKTTLNVLVRAKFKYIGLPSEEIKKKLKNIFRLYDLRFNPLLEVST